MADTLEDILLNNSFNGDNLYKKIHIIMRIIDNIGNLFKNDLNCRFCVFLWNQEKTPKSLK